MSDIMKDLHQDHINFSKLLKLLSQKLEMLNNHDRPDFSVMLDCVDYLENYADLYHHPKEDLMYTLYLERGGEANKDIQHLMEQHKTLKEMTNRLGRTLDAILHGDIVPKDKFIQQLSDYIEYQQNHLNAEEARLFPRLEQQLTEWDWGRLEQWMPSRSDPLFGSQTEQRYKALYARIAEMS